MQPHAANCIRNRYICLIFQAARTAYLKKVQFDEVWLQIHSPPTCLHRYISPDRPFTVNLQNLSYIPPTHSTNQCLKAKAGVCSLSVFDSTANSLEWLPVCFLHTYDVRHRAKVHRHPSSCSCSLSPSLQCYLCIPSHFSTCTHCPLYKQDLWKHGLLFPVAGHWSVLHLPPRPSHVLYWNNTLSLLEETEAHGEMHKQRDNQLVLPLHLQPTEESRQGSEKKDLARNSPLLVWLANGDRRTSESTAGQNSSLY